MAIEGFEVYFLLSNNSNNNSRDETNQNCSSSGFPFTAREASEMQLVEITLGLQSPILWYLKNSACRSVWSAIRYCRIHTHMSHNELRNTPDYKVIGDKRRPRGGWGGRWNRIRNCCLISGAKKQEPDGQWDSFIYSLANGGWTTLVLRVRS